MGKPGRPSPGLDDYLYWQERLANRTRRMTRPNQYKRERQLVLLLAHHAPLQVNLLDERPAQGGA